MIIMVILLVGVIVLLWMIHQDLLETNQRLRNTKMELIKLVDRVERLTAEPEDEPAAKSLEKTP